MAGQLTLKNRRVPLKNRIFLPLNPIFGHRDAKWALNLLEKRFVYMFLKCNYTDRWHEFSSSQLCRHCVEIAKYMQI